MSRYVVLLCINEPLKDVLNDGHACGLERVTSLSLKAEERSPRVRTLAREYEGCRSLGNEDQGQAYFQANIAE